MPELLRILDEIKESFATARYLYYLSHEQNTAIDHISKITLYHGVGAFEINGLYIGLCKTAYARAFDILDKVARIVNVYFGVGKRELPFWTLFAEKQSLGQEQIIRFKTRDSIVETGNYSLYALADLCIDYFESEHVDLKTIDRRRNKITHDYLAVKLYALEDENDSVISLDELQTQTNKVLHLAKYATLYVVSAVSIAENTKAKGAGNLVDIEYLDRPGQPFL